MTQDFRLANVHVRADLGALALIEYATSAADTLAWYDGDGAGTPDGITAAVIGRSAFMDARLTRTEVSALVAAAATAPWATVPVDARLRDADPQVRGGLYDAAERLHRHFLDAAGRVGATSISTVLHITRPGLFPILDATVRQLYTDRAAAAWHAETRPERPYSGRSYWPVIREDITEAADVLADWRAQLARSGQPAQRRLSTLSDVRLWDIVTRQIAGAGQNAGWYAAALSVG
ncbi:MAG: hypothetical protein QOF82_1277 [Frankiales bacterium]|jgi:hypothetical protein|nr:hypothetical protein [Frankiales bacterium]MDX6212190.1 hypothetical protein [Frankiales bacterium]